MSVAVAARRLATGPQGVRRAPVPAALYFRGLGPPAAARAPALPLAPLQRLLQARRRAAVPRPPRRPRGRPHQRPVRRRLQRPPRQPLGDVRLPRARGRPGDPAAAARGRRAVAALARARPHDRPDGLHDERRERRDDRGLRARADDQAALAPALLPAARRGGRAGQGDGPADVGAGDRRPREDPARHLQARRRGRAAPRHPAAQDDAALAAPGHGPLRRGLQRGLERELGLLARTPRRTSTPTPRSCSSSSTSTGSWSPRRRRGRPWPSRSPCPTSTRCWRR